MKITIVMPVFDEEALLRKTLSSLKITEREELIVVDGGSNDNSVSIAREFTDKVFAGEKGRARQMNLGAQNARSDILLFLHADCILPENGFKVIRKVMEGNNASAGAFDLSIDNQSIMYRIIETAANMRSRITSMPYGDQGIFTRRKFFENIGGFSDIPLMEDIEIAARLKKIGKIVFVKPAIKTSARRWDKEGALYTTLRDWALALSFVLFGASPQTLAKYYKDVR